MMIQAIALNKTDSLDYGSQGVSPEEMVDDRELRFAFLPLGYITGKGKCPECDSFQLAAVVNSPFDEQDPDIKCEDCGYRW